MGGRAKRQFARLFSQGGPKQWRRPGRRSVKAEVNPRRIFPPQPECILQCFLSDTANKQLQGQKPEVES